MLVIHDAGRDTLSHATSLCTSLGSEVKFSNNSYVKLAELRIESQQCNTTTHQLQTQLWTCEGAVANATHHRQQQEAIRQQEEAIRQQEEAIRNNKAPRIMAGSDRDIFEGDNVELIATATDPEGDHLTIQWELVHGPTALSGVPFIGPQLKLSNMPVGTFNFQASTSDSFNKSASASVTVNVRPKHSIGIDLGTTFSCISHSQNSKPRALFAEPKFGKICSLPRQLISRYQE